MKWFRSNIKRVSRLALFALAIQFALSFGHFDWVAAGAASAARSGLTQAELPVADNLSVQHNLAAPRPGSDPGSGEHPGDICAICVVMAMANAVLFAMPPVVLLPRTVESIYLAPGADLVRVKAVRAGFQSRAPPVSLTSI